MIRHSAAHNTFLMLAFILVLLIISTRSIVNNMTNR